MLMMMLPAWIASRAATRSRAGRAVDALAAGVVDQLRVEVPGVDRDVAGVRVADEDADLVVVGFWLCEGVV